MDLNRPPFWKNFLEVLGLLALFISWWLGDGGWFLLITGAVWICAGEIGWHHASDLSASPYPWLLLSPLLLWHYSSVADFRIRLVCFIMLVYILILAQRRENSRRRLSLHHVTPWRIWLLAFLVFALTACVFYVRGIYLSGDEPHYMMITQSLVEDGDFDLHNNLRDKTYLSYLPVELRFHGTIRDGRYRSFHLPGISVLLVPFFYLFNLLGGAIPANLYFRLCAAVLNAFFALGLFQILKKSWPDKDNSILFLFFITTFPLVFQAVHLYPELPAATLLIFAYLHSRSQRPHYFLAGLLLAGIPWLHFKYLLPMLILVFFVTAGIWRGGARLKAKMRASAFFLIPQAISAVLLAVYSKVLYGSFDPTIISPEKNFLAIPLGNKINTLLSFFLDQRDGLLVYAPVFLMLFLVFKKETRKSLRDFSLLSAIFFSYILFHAYTTVRGGYSPAARPTLFVLWIMMIFSIASYRQAGELGKTLFRFLAGLTCFATVWLFYYPLFLYQPVTREVSQRASALLLFLGSATVDLSSVFPSFLKKTNVNYLPNWIWLAVLAVGIILYYARPPWQAVTRPARFVFQALCLLLLFFICFIPHVQLRTRYSAAKLVFYSNSHNFSFHRESGSFKILAGQDYDLFFDLDGSAAENLDLSLLNPKGIAVCIKNGRRTLLDKNADTESRFSVSLRALNKFSLGKRDLVHLGLESTAGPGTVFFWLKFR